MRLSNPVAGAAGFCDVADPGAAGCGHFCSRFRSAEAGSFHLSMGNLEAFPVKLSSVIWIFMAPIRNSIWNGNGLTTYF